VVSRLFGAWAVAGAAACGNERQESTGRALSSPASSLGSNSISLPKPRESTAKTEDLRGGELTPESTDLQVLLTAPADFAHNSGR
jgi:hypothetical protein